MYIKFKECDQESLNEAIEIAESLWATKCKARDAIEFKWTGVLFVNQKKEYYTIDFTIQQLKEFFNCTEYKPEPKFKRWEKVLVRYSNTGWGLEAIYITTIKWAVRPYVVVADGYQKAFNDWKEFYTELYPLIEKIETIKLETKDWQTISISKDQAKELWFNIN